MKSSITPIENKKIYESIGDQIVQMIKDQSYPEGSRLPSEAELAESFQVGRSSVREAIKSLHMSGIVVSRAGKGTYVSDNAIMSINLMRIVELINDEKCVSDLAETRMLLEQDIAGVAARRWDAADMKELDNWMEKLAASDEKEQVLACGHMFHNAMCNATHNEVLVELYKSVSRRRLKAPNTDSQTVEECRSLAIEEHQAILDAIKARDSELAEKLAGQHIMNNYGSYMKK